MQNPNPPIVVVAMPNMDGAEAYVEFWMSLGHTREEAINEMEAAGVIAPCEAKALRGDS